MAAAVLLATPGCFWVNTKSDGTKLRKDVAALDKRVADKEQDMGSKIAELKTTLDDAAKLLKRNSADLGADLDALRADVRKATGLVETISADYAETKKSYELRLASLEQRLAALETGKGAAPAGDTPESLWSLGKVAFEAARYAEAAETFRKLATLHPAHDRADDAQYFRAEALVKAGDNEAAIREYQRVFDRYADSTLADDAMFRAAEAAFAIKQCGEARAYLAQLKTKYPKSNLIKKADEKDKEIKGVLKTKAKCES